MAPNTKLSFELCEISEENWKEKVAVIREGIIPLFVWDKVVVIRENSYELRKVERFLLEAALKLKTFYPAEIKTITNLPIRAIRRVGYRLARMGTLERTPDQSGFSVIREKAAQALNQEALVERTEDTAMFLYLPRTDDLLIFMDEKRVHTGRNLSRSVPVARAPVPGSIVGLNRYDFLQQKIFARKVSNLPDNIVDVSIPDQPRPIPDTCSVYKCTGGLTSANGHVQAVLNFLSGNPRNGTDRMGTVDLTGADGLIEKCRILSEILEQTGYREKLWHIIDSNGSEPESAQKINLSEWVFLIPGKSAACIARNRPLHEPLGLLVSEEDLRLEIGLRFYPADNDAKVYFAVDQAVSMLLKNRAAVTKTGIEAAFRKAAEQYACDTLNYADCTQIILDRLWQLQEYRLIYDLREKEDFSYE